ncbi:hypothetical protein SKAU_G00068370 [Synaphobranchus kaupii]|uniref:Uncharacterized protein n=1 Tax=Synaphobranchus kaupii TaxID=118154 RepID=A0A9Q1G7C1_SYNKA|nr:hypothetical protein SKAU_G00068370 [Synaphobranchus kaupii]
MQAFAAAGREGASACEWKSVHDESGAVAAGRTARVGFRNRRDHVEGDAGCASLITPPRSSIGLSLRPSDRRTVQMCRAERFLRERRLCKDSKPVGSRPYGTDIRGS